MLVQLASMNPLIVVLVFIAILTLFGKKKKEEPKALGPTPPPSASGTGESTSVGNISAGPEDNPFEKLLQSLMQDIPFGEARDKEDFQRSPSATPEWVPPRATPPSRAMVVVSNDQGKRLVNAQEAAGPKPIAPRPTMQAQFSPPVQTASTEAPTVSSLPQPGAAGRGPAGSVPRFEGLAEDLNKLEKEVKEKLEAPQAEKPSSDKSSDQERIGKKEPERLEQTRSSTGNVSKEFAHVFELTQGSLKSSGLALIRGPNGSGKTSFCLDLAEASLNEGTPCLYVAYDQAPSEIRESLKKIGCDVSKFESQFRFLLIDGHSAQSEAFSFEPYFVEQPFDLASLQDALVRNVGVFLGERVVIVVDSIDGMVSKIPSKEFAKGFRELEEKLKEFGATLVAAVTSDTLIKELSGPLEEMANCVLDLEKEGSNNGRLRIRRLNGSSVAADPEPFEFVATKGLVFT